MSNYHGASSSSSSSSGGPSMIGMIRARKLATKIKKRAQFLVAERRRRDNTGKAAIVHRDFPKITRNDDQLGIGKSFHTLKIQTPTQSRSPSVASKQGYSTTINAIQEAKNTYRTEPVHKFSRKEVTNVIEEALNEHLEGQTYNYEFCKDTSKRLSDIIKQRVKYLGYNRYKLICVVYMGQVKNQGMRIASRCLWNTQFDNVAEASFRNGELFAVATVFGAFYE